MTPALAFFYGGLARRKNVVNTMFMSIAVIGVVGVVWAIAGWTIAFGGASTDINPVIGGFDQFFLAGITTDSLWSTYGFPSFAMVAFQAAFAIITIAIITGSLAGRIKFGAIIAFVAIWCIFVYAPLAHMVWGGGFIGGTIGALDFAGGDVVHISSGVTGLVVCILLGRRRGYGKLSYRPHNIPFVVLGSGLLWLGWFGFNAASAYGANGDAALALVNTMFAPCAAMVSWMIVEKIHTGKTTLAGACTGIVAGLVVITPAAGFVETWAALIMGFVVAPICYSAIAFLKPKLGYDDALDAFGCHGVGGIVGGLFTGLFAAPDAIAAAGFVDHDYGLIYGGGLLGSQALGILVTLLFVIVMSLIIGLIVKAMFGGKLAVSDAIQAEGLDACLHGESAYPAYDGLD
jgi:ammonium transporter, Amt family